MNEKRKFYITGLILCAFVLIVVPGILANRAIKADKSGGFASDDRKIAISGNARSNNQVDSKEIEKPISDIQNVGMDMFSALGPGDNCSNPISITLPDEMEGGIYVTMDSTCFRDNDYDSTCLDYYDGGEDIIYELNVTSPIDVTIMLDPMVTTYTGISIDNACPPGESCLSTSARYSPNPHGFSIHLDPGSYYVMIDTWPSPTCIPQFTLTIEVVSASENDDWADCLAIGDVVDLEFNTTMATFDGPGLCQTAPSLWYCYTASCDGEATFSLCGSGYDTKMAVYDGVGDPAALIMLDCNDDYCSVQSQITWMAVSGNSYLVEVGGYSSSVGSGIINTSCMSCTTPLNDNCEDVIPTILPFNFTATFNGDNTCATSQCTLIPGDGHAWEAFTTIGLADVTIDYCGTSPYFELVYAVLADACPCEDGSGEMIFATATDWGICGDGNATMVFEQLPAGTYYIPVLSDYPSYPTEYYEGPYTINVLAVPTDPDYCLASGGCDEHIANVTVESINNTSGCEGYGDFTAQTAYMTTGMEYPITITLAGAYSADAGGVWIDWNQDFDFDDANETITLDDSVGYGPYTGTIYVPASALAGDTRMRIRLDYYSTPNPCGTTAFGEVEDYTINVTGRQVDLYVHSLYLGTPTIQPGQEVELGFTVENIGSDSTILQGILNFIYIYDTLNDFPETEIKTTTASCVSHSYSRMGPGDVENIVVTVKIPSDEPYDATLRIAVLTDWADEEPELDELNNITFVDIPVEPLTLSLTTGDIMVTDTIDLEGYDDIFQFSGQPGNVVFAEIVAHRLGSQLDPHLQLQDPIMDVLLSGEGDFSRIEPDSRLINLGLPGTDMYRLEVSGDPVVSRDSGQTGWYELHLQQAIPEIESNDSPGSANSYNLGDIVYGHISVEGDVDYFTFYGSYGDILEIDIDAAEVFEGLPDSIIDPVVVLLNSAGDTLFYSDDEDEYDPYILAILPETGTVYLRIEDMPGGGEGGGFPEYAYAFRITQLLGVTKPDLSPSDISTTPGSVEAGDSVQVDFNAWNLGDLATQTGVVFVDIRLSEDAVIDELDTLLAYGDLDGDINAGTYVAGQEWIQIPPGLPAGDYYLGLILDQIDMEVEENEANNTAAIQIIFDSFVCGDANASGSINILDITYLISYLYKGGPAPNPLESGDVNNSGSVNILDITYLISFLYKGGPAPVCP